MFDTYVTIVGNVLTAPEWRRTAQSDTLVANFKVASTARRLDRDSGRWVDGNRLRVRVNCWRKLAEGVAASVMVGDPVVVCGRLYTRDWTDDAGNHRTALRVGGGRRRPRPVAGPGPVPAQPAEHDHQHGGGRRGREPGARRGDRAGAGGARRPCCPTTGRWTTTSSCPTTPRCGPARSPTTRWMPMVRGGASDALSSCRPGSGPTGGQIGRGTAWPASTRGDGSPLEANEDGSRRAGRRVGAGAGRGAARAVQAGRGRRGRAAVPQPA